jgi:hypothetical protein
VSTERTILSPFTKEYRVLAAHSGIHQSFEGLISIYFFPYTTILSFDMSNLIYVIGNQRMKAKKISQRDFRYVSGE